MCWGLLIRKRNEKFGRREEGVDDGSLATNLDRQVQLF